MQLYENFLLGSFYNRINNPSAVSSEQTYFPDVGDINNGFGIGEYNKLLITEDKAIPIWADGRLGGGLVRVYMAEVDLNTTNIESIRPIDNNNFISKIYPDPAKDDINAVVNLDQPLEISFEIYNNNSKLVYSIDKKHYGSNKNEILISTSDLKSGVYYLKMNTDIGYSVKKFVIKK